MRFFRKIDRAAVRMDKVAVFRVINGLIAVKINVG